MRIRSVQTYLGRQLRDREYVACKVTFVLEKPRSHVQPRPIINRRPNRITPRKYLAWQKRSPFKNPLAAFRNTCSIMGWLLIPHACAPPVRFRRGSSQSFGPPAIFVPRLLRSRALFRCSAEKPYMVGTCVRMYRYPSGPQRLSYVQAKTRKQELSTPFTFQEVDVNHSHSTHLCGRAVCGLERDWK
jgi:hypothetical protein